MIMGVIEIELPTTFQVASVPWSVSRNQVSWVAPMMSWLPSPEVKRWWTQSWKKRSFSR